MVGVMFSVGGGLGWAVNPDLAGGVLHPRCGPPKGACWTGFCVSGQV